MTPTVRRPWPHTWLAGLAWGLWVLTLAILPVAVWLDQLLRQAGRADLAIVGANVPLIVAVVSAATVGAVLASRRPAHPVGWLLLAVGLSEHSPTSPASMCTTG